MSQYVLRTPLSVLLDTITNPTREVGAEQTECPKALAANKVTRPSVESPNP